MFQITCCSTVDMPLSFFKDRNIPFVYFHYIIDGVEYDDDCGQTISYKDFYKLINNGAMPTTSQVNVDQYTAMFEAILSSGKDVIHLTLSSGISGTYNSAMAAKKICDTKYPDRKLYVIDSLCASSGYGLIVSMLADMRDKGVGTEEAYNWAENHKQNINHWFFTTDLSHLKRGGRISPTSAALGSLLNICPVLMVDSKGKLVPKTKVRGVKKTIKTMFSLMETHALNNTNYNGYCYISHSAVDDYALELKKTIEDNFPNLKNKVLVNDIGMVIGSHTGPGTVALFFYGDNRTV